MATQNTAAADSGGAAAPVKLGEFPFPLSDGQEESRYITWLRNHSNYMVVRGFLDYLRSIGVLIRGIIVNFLIFLPYLLVIAIVLAYSHHWMLEHPYLLTFGAIVFSMGWILLFPVAMPLYKICMHGRNLGAETRGSINLRDIYERSFSAILLLIFATAVIESLPWLLEFLLDQIEAGKFGWRASLATVVAALALFGGSDKLLSLLSGAKKALATILVGLFGLLVPMLVILYATYFLLYSPPATPWVMFSPLIAAGCYVAAIVIAILLGLRGKAFTRKELMVVFGMLAAAVALVYFVMAGTVFKTRVVHPHDTPLNKIIAPMQYVASHFDEITNRQGMAPEVAAFVDEVVKAERETRKTRDALRNQSESDCFKKRYAKDLRQRWDCEQEIAEWEGMRYSAAAKYFELGDKLSALPETSLDPLRAEMGKLARARLWSLIKAREDDKDCGYYGWCKGDELVQRVRRILIFRQLLPLPPEGDDEVEFSPEKIDSICKHFATDGLAEARYVCEKFAVTFTAKRHNDAIETSIAKTQNLLMKVSNEELAELISESDLYHQVNEKFNSANLYGQAEIARLAGKPALAGLLTKQELLCSIFYVSRHCNAVIVGDAVPLKVSKTADSADAKALGRPASDAGKPIIYRHDFHRATKWAFVQAVLPKLPKSAASSLAERDVTELSSFGVQQRKRPTQLSDTEVKELATLARLASWKPLSDKEPQALRERLRSPWGKPTEEEMERWSDDSILHPEYLARVAGEQLLGYVLNEVGVPRVEHLLARLTVDWAQVDYDPQRQKDKNFVESLFVDSVACPKSLDDPIANLVGAVTSMKEKARHEKKLPPLAELDCDIELVMELARRVHIHPARLKEQARAVLMRQALLINNRNVSEFVTSPQQSLEHFTQFQMRRIATQRGDFLELRPYAEDLTSGALLSMAVTKFINRTPGDIDAIDKLITSAVLGAHGGLERPDEALKKKLTAVTISSKAIFLFLLAAVIWLGCWLAVDVNLTSIHGLYRDRLASAFLVGEHTRVDLNPERSIDLSGICRYEARSIAPYHLINVALNLQGSRDIGLRDRNSDFFIFSKRFIGGHRTGYCRSETMEQVFPQLDLATAMAISAAAAAPNMGRGTSPLLVAFMTMLNIRLGFWLPNPGLLEQKLNKTLSGRKNDDPQYASTPPGFTFEEVFAQEFMEIQRRWAQVYAGVVPRRGLAMPISDPFLPTVENQLVGIAFSGGGIRSAAINLGIAQALHKSGVFDHLDYLSTVSGGGYLGSSISALMRSREALVSTIAGEATVTPGEPGDAANGDTIVLVKGDGEDAVFRFTGDADLAVTTGDKVAVGQPLLKHWSSRSESAIAGTVDVIGDDASAGQILNIRGQGQQRAYRFSRYDDLRVAQGDKVKQGQRLIRTHHSVGERFLWRVRPLAFVWEMFSKLDERHRWVNLSDGGHIENLAAIELLRRRCKYIIIGDGEADPYLHFNGLATLMRCASIDLGIEIDINLDASRLKKAVADDQSPLVSGEHWAVGTITYPPKNAGDPCEIGQLLYLKSSFSGDEGVTIQEYRNRNIEFPHQATADQFFDEGQFEAYRALGEHIADMALRLNDTSLTTAPDLKSFEAFEEWFDALSRKSPGMTES